MTAPLHDRELDALLAGWLDEGPNTAAGFVVERAMARVPTVRRRGAPWWPQLPRVLRTQGPLLASVAVLLVLGAATLLALGLIFRPDVPPPSSPPAPSFRARLNSSVPMNRLARASKPRSHSVSISGGGHSIRGVRRAQGARRPDSTRHEVEVCRS